ncbi:MAG: riboflavin biosynthesis protein RibF [Bdellovibrionota bacterium]
MPRSITIGNFDGVHLGHRALIKRVTELSNAQTTPMVLSFDPHPREFLGIRPIPARLCSLEEKKRRINELGITEIHIQKFDKAFSDLSAEEFLKWLRDNFNPKHIVVGTNFFFGKNRGGNTQVLQEWGSQNKIHTEVLQPIEHDSIIVSSTEIRVHIQSGNIKLANKICGFDYALPMTAQHGDARGRELGFPTINSAPPQLESPALYCLPPHGVYVTLLRIENQLFPAITNFGIRPTFHNATEGEYFETHILSGWDDRLSSKHFTVYFLDRIRPEQRYSDKNELILRIQEDIKIARTLHKL